MALDIDHFKALLLRLQTQLEELSENATTARKPVELDQQSVGRLSRQDALQHQAMAQAQDRLRQLDLIKITKALQRIEEGEYGFCEECGDDLAAKRLEIDPMAIICVSCLDPKTDRSSNNPI